MKIPEAVKAQIVRRWGRDAQLNQAIEELNELAVAISHYRRKDTRDNRLAIAEEIADVQLMIEQLQYMLNLSDTCIGVYIEEKIQRVNKLLKTPAPTQAQSVTPESVS